MNILITGIAGFIGSSLARFYSQDENNLIFGIDDFSKNEFSNCEELKQYEHIKEIKKKNIENITQLDLDKHEIDWIFHCAGQTAVTKSLLDPYKDFCTNLRGTFSLLEAMRNAKKESKMIFCSTNKVYGNNINREEVIERPNRYSFWDFNMIGFNERFDIDHCQHSPYGTSKLTADLYCQEYSLTYGLKIGVFRMSCIYGTHQFGMEDQGWIAHFILSALQNKKINIYGDGKQVRDVLYVSDLIDAFDKFMNSSISHSVYNIGGGINNTLSLRELLSILSTKLEKEIEIKYHEWRPADQKVYISEINKVSQELKWSPLIAPREGIEKVIKWGKSLK